MNEPFSPTNIKPRAPHEEPAAPAAETPKVRRSFVSPFLGLLKRYGLLLVAFFFAYVSVVLLALSNLSRWVKLWAAARARGDLKKIELEMTGLEDYDNLLELCTGLCLMFIVLLAICIWV